MSSNVQYNSPMPLYSREAAEEQYKQQIGSGPDVHLGSSTKHFDPNRSETLKAIQQGEDDSFGKHFFEQIAIAEARRTPTMHEPHWTNEAKRRSEKTRSLTPDYTKMYYSPQYTVPHTRNRSNDVRSSSVAKRGYEFGGLDYVDKSRISRDNGFCYYEPQRKSEERKSQQGYEMGGTDFTRKGIGFSGGSYHGHGPETPRLHPKYINNELKHHELNIDVAPNVDRVSADILIGDTISNQHIVQDDHHPNADKYGTYFGPTEGFKKDHRAVRRPVEQHQAQTFSISTKKYGSNRDDASNQHRRSHLSANEQYSNGDIWTAPQSRLSSAHSEASRDHYEWSETNSKKVTVETLLNDEALVAEKRECTPDWHRKSAEKQNHWKYQADPRLSRPQLFANEPNWSDTARRRKNEWESKAHSTEELQIPASYKVPQQQPPYWYNKASRTHNIWQEAAERQAHNKDRQYYINNETYHTGDHTGSFSTQTNYSSKYPDSNTIIKDTQYNKYTSEHEAPISQNVHRSYAFAPVPASQPYDTVRPTEWKSTVSTQPAQNYESKYSLYEGQMRETSSEQITNEPQRTYSYSTERSQPQPLSASATTVSHGAYIDRRVEMAEALPAGAIANTEASTEGNYLDGNGEEVSYKRELTTSVDPNIERSLLKEEERRVVETPLEPGVISRHVTTKYYKKKTVTDTTTTTE